MKRILFSTFAGLLSLTGCKERGKVSSVPTNTIEMNENQSSIPLDTTTIHVTPIEHATAILKWKDITIYVDPVGGIDAFKDHNTPDLILITHTHGDHFNIETLQELDTRRAKIIVPRTVAEKIPVNFTPQLDVLNNGDSKERFGINIEAIPMYNLREEALKFHKKGEGNGYILNIGKQRLYFSGDTEDIPEMRALKNIDKAFICMNLPYTMSPETAADAVLDFKPAEVYPYHYRGKPEVSDVKKFKDLVNKGNPEIKVIQWDWYPNDEF